MTVSNFVENSIGLKRDNLFAAYIKFKKHFLNSTTELIVKLQYWLKNSSAEPIFYGDLVYNINSKELLENPILVIHSKRLSNVIQKVGYHATVCMLDCKPNHSL